MTTTSDPIWQFWSGPLPDHIALCLETVAAHHPGRVQLLTSVPDECWRVMGCVHPDTRPAHVADVLRAYLLWKHGGFWVDSDFLCFAPLDTLVPQEPTVPHTHFAAYGRPDYDGYDNDFLWTSRASWVPELFRIGVSDYLAKRGGQVALWGDIGAAILTDIFRTHGMVGVEKVPHERVSLLRRGAYTLDLPLPDDEAAAWQVPEGCAGMMLVNSVSGPYLKDKSIHEILSSRTIVGHLFREALRRLPR